MPVHQFKVGSVVLLNPDGQSLPATSRYVIEAQMPPVGTSLQYRIKSEAEGFRRVVVEHQLRLVGATAVPADRADKPHRGEEN